MAETYLGPCVAGRFTEGEMVDWAWTVAGEFHRQVKGRSTLRVLFDGRAYFLKRHLGVGWGEIIKNWAVGKQAVLGAENEYRACLHLARHDVRAPRVAAFAVERRSPARRRSFVLCEELAGFDSLEAVTDAWAAAPPNPLAKRRLLLAVAQFVRRLHEIGLAHRDLYICHLLLDREKWAAGDADLAVLDLHRARVAATIPLFWRKRDLAALLFSTLHLDLPRFSWLRFVRIYAGRPLREVFQQDGGFWRSVERRAKALQKKALMRTGHDGLKPPFTVVCSGAAFQIEQVFRWLPGRRLTARTSWQGRAVVLKLFLGRSAGRHCAKEKRGAQRLMASGVATPRLLAEMAAPEAGGRALLFECLANAKPIGRCLEQRVADETAAAVVILARLHVQGLTHKDMHHGNFVQSQGEVYILDSGGVVQMRPPSERAGLRALAVLLAQCRLSANSRISDLLACYERARRWRANPIRLAHFQHWLAMARRLRIKHYQAKTQRNCTEFAVHREKGRRFTSRRDWAWVREIAQSGSSPSQALLTALEDAEIIKTGNSATVFRLKLAGESVVVKRYSIKSLTHRVRRWFRSNPRIAWRNGQALRLLGIQTAEPLALVECHWGLFTAEDLLVTRDLGNLNLATETLALGWHPGRLDQVANLFQQLSAIGLSHGDARATNFLVHGDQVHLIDLGCLAFDADRARDIRRFLDDFDGVLREQAEAKFAESGLI